MFNVIIYICLHKYIEILFDISRYHEILLENINRKYALATPIREKIHGNVYITFL